MKHTLLNDNYLYIYISLDTILSKCRSSNRNSLLYWFAKFYKHISSNTIFVNDRRSTYNIIHPIATQRHKICRTNKIRPQPIKKQNIHIQKQTDLNLVRNLSIWDRISKHMHDSQKHKKSVTF